MTHLSRRALLGAGLATVVTASTAYGDEMNPDFPPYVSTGRPPRKTFWKEGPVLNQFYRESCEGYALVGAYLSATNAPLTVKQGNALARKIWNRSIDNNVGVYEVARSFGLVRSWTLPQTVDELVDAVCYHGPVTLGVRMTERFRKTSGREIIVGSTSNDWIGHAMVATAYLPKDEVAGRGPSIRLRNSWGPHWGQNGSAWITVEDLKRNIGKRPHAGIYQDMWAANWIKP